MGAFVDACVVLDKLTTKVILGEAKIESLSKYKDSALDKREEAKSVVAVFEKVMLLFNNMGEEAQDILRSKLETLVSYGLQVVFQEKYQFKMNTRILRGQVSMEFTVIKDGIETDVMFSHGGGIAVVVAFILQFVVLAILKGVVAPVLVMDEALAQLSENYRERMALFIRELVDKTDIQIIFVTHQLVYCDVADKSFQFQIKNGETVVTESAKFDNCLRTHGGELNGETVVCEV